MQKILILCMSVLISGLLFAVPAGLANDTSGWYQLKKINYTIYYTRQDETIVKQIDRYVESGVAAVSAFFDQLFLQKIEVYIFPDRNSLNKQWQHDWNEPSFQSECWMVASGVGCRLDMLSINAWPKEACDHNSKDTAEVRKIIWHELMHVFHGQYNPDHSMNIENQDWLVEGMATYVSGQLDAERLRNTGKSIEDNPVMSLKEVWKGNDKYGKAGSMVAFIDKKFDRKKLFELLKFMSKEQVLDFLGLTEYQLLTGWVASVKSESF